MPAKIHRSLRKDVSKPETPATMLAPKWVLGKVFKSLCSMSRTRVGSAAYELFKANKFADLCSLVVDPRDYRKESIQTFAIDYQIVSFLSKYQGFDNSVADKKGNALKKWRETEARCKATNQTFRSRWDGETTFRHHVEEALYLSKQKMREILGRFDGELFVESCKFGPGVDTAIWDVTKTSSYYKYKTNGHATPGAARVMEEFFHNDARLEYSNSCQLRDSSALFFVVKTWDELRTACKSPRWNSFLQGGLGGCIEERLRSAGIDIKYQADTNRRLASTAHIDGNVTVDLKSASDSFAVNVCIDFLEDFSEIDPGLLFSERNSSDNWGPCEGSSYWLDLILALREPYTVLPGKEKIRQEKVSSMGNGYTFPLETLFFYSCALGVCQTLGVPSKDVSVFGDDIIVPRDAAQLLIELLTCCGFVPNIKKTFLRGEFFESCGYDYFRGRNVRPAFLKKELLYVSDLYRLHNRLIAWGSRISSHYATDGVHRCVDRLCRHITSGIPRSFRTFGLRSESDGHLHAPFDVVRPILAHNYVNPKGKRPYVGWEGYIFKSWGPTPIKDWGMSYRAHLFSKLGGITDTGNFVVQRAEGPWSKQEQIVLTSDFIWSD